MMAAVGLWAGCVDKKAEGPGAARPDAAAEPTKQARPALKASEDDCVGPLTKSGKPREIAFADHRFQLDGYLLSQLNKDPDDEIVVGIISDTKENTEDNQKNIERILEFFEREKAQVIIHLGDIASTTPLPEEIDVPEKDEQGKALTEEDQARFRRRVIARARVDSMKKSYEDIVDLVSRLAEKELPLLVIGGNRECKSTFNTALDTVSEDFRNVFNMNRIRRAELDDLTVISMPGYHDPEYVHCPWDKCLYFESDTLGLIDLARESKAPVLVISHGPPRQQDRNGIDAVSEGANVGNPALADAIRKAGIPFGAFGNIQEAGGKATNLEGTSILPQDTFLTSLYLNPGPADSVAWSMNDGTESRGMAAVIHFVGNKAKYKVFRVGEEKRQPAP
jgi:Icc-related predicted phosphoesterase